MDSFWSDSYVLTLEAQPEGSSCALCLDAARFIRQTYHPQHSALFFSATLTPPHWFARALGGRSRDERPDALRLASPFPEEHRLLIVHQGIETDYRSREASSLELARAIALTAIRAHGNSLCFFPSYAYLRLVAPRARAIAARYGVDCLMQTAAMSDAQRRDFLAVFEADAVEGKKTLGFAVLGGSFGEGIDLVGERLKGVIVVGVGLPGIGPERELLRQYYNEQGENGFAFAYQIPGFIRVKQAAGRLIRSEHDTGVILLIDSRYARPDYLEIWPDDWRAEYCDTLEELNALLQEIPQSDAEIKAQNGR